MDVSEIIRRGGGASKLAATIGRDHSAVVKWRRAGLVPLDNVAAVSRATGIPAADIRPDIAIIFAPQRRKRRA